MAWSADQGADNVLRHLSAEDKDKLLLQMLDESAEKDKLEALMSLLSDSSKSERLIELVDGGALSPGKNFGSDATLLEYAVTFNHERLARLLLDHHRYSENTLYLTLELACVNERNGVARALIKRGLNVNKPLPMSNESCLFIAIRDANVELLSVLIESGADPALKGATGRTAVQEAKLREEQAEKAHLILRQN